MKKPKPGQAQQPTTAEIESFLRDFLACEGEPADRREGRLASCYGVAKQLLERVSPACRSADPSISVADLGLPVRTYNTLIGNGISTLGELLRCDEFDLRVLPGLGRESCIAIAAVVAPYGGLADTAVRAAERAREREMHATPDDLAHSMS